MHTQGFYYASLHVLETLVRLNRYTVCRCYRDRPVDLFDNGLLQSPLGKRHLTTQDILNKVMVPCVYFLPSEKNVMPTALCYEMRQADYVQAAPRADFINDSDLLFNDWAMVDGQFLLHFLLYLNHVKLNMVPHAAADISYMERLLKTQSTSHKETCWNILGWIYKEQCNPVKAMECYRKSFKVKQHCNAAFWHTKGLEGTGT